MSNPVRPIQLAMIAVNLALVAIWLVMGSGVPALINLGGAVLCTLVWLVTEAVCAS